MRTEYPCEMCGAGVFQRTAARKRFCSKRCARRAWHRAHPGSRGAAAPGRYSVTVTYTDADGEQWTTVGTDRTPRGAREDADSQVPLWFVARGPLKTHASTPQSILRSLKRAAE